MKKLLLFAGAALGSVAVGVVSAQAQAGTGNVMREARVTQVVKDVKLLSGGEPRPATLSDTVRGDTAVRTGAESRAELTFGDLTIARLGANTIFSFNQGTRTVDLGNGAILLRVPKGSGGAKVQTAAVTAAITGTTVIVEYHPKSYAKYLVLEGSMRIFLKGILGESVLMGPGQMMILNPNAKRLSEPVDFDLARLWKTSLFIQGFRPLGSEPLMAEVTQTQLDRKAAGELIDTNLVIFGRGTLVSLTDPQSTDVVDRKTAAVTLPTPTVPPVPTPTPTIAPSPTPTVAPSPTPTIAPSPTPKPTPSKFGTPPPIITSVPYPIDNGTTIQTDPAITRGGVTDFGKIYRNPAQDGPFSAWAFTATSPFDNTVGVDALYGANVPQAAVAAFKFVALRLVGNPTISTANGGAINLALISVGPITTATSGNAVFTFTGMQNVLLATQNGSIDISGPDITFQNIPRLYFYARGIGSNLTLGGMGVFGVSELQLLAENNVQINAPVSVSSGDSGGTVFGTAGGTLAVNSPIETPTGTVAPGGPSLVTGIGGEVSLSALGGTLTVGSRIQTAYNTLLGASGPRSMTGGTITLASGLTTGTGISLTSSASLLSLLNAAAPGPAGSITLSTPGSDIVSNGATIEADRGTITIQHTAAPPAGTAQITLDGGTISSETLLASSRGDLSIGATTPVNLFAVSVSFITNRNLTWSGGTLSATASASSGNVFLIGNNDVTILNAADIQRFNGGITDGLLITLAAARNLQVNQGLTLLTDGSGLTTGGNILVSSGAAMTFGGIANFQTGPNAGNQGEGSSITIQAGGAITASDLFASVQIGAGRTLINGGTIRLQGSASYTATLGDGGLNLRVVNSSPGTINNGGNVAVALGSLTTGPGGALNLAVDNSGGGQIQTGGNVSAAFGGAVTASSVNVQVDNRSKGFIGNGGSILFSASGTLTTKSDASFETLNSQLGTPGGTIGSDPSIKITLADASIGRDLNAFIDNSDGSIGGAGGSVTLQINGKLAVTGRINVSGSLTSTGTVTTGQLSATNVNAPGISVGAGGITQFTFPNELNGIPILHTITANALTSTGGINFNGQDTGPFNGGQLTINVPSLSFGPSAADNIQGPVTFNGGNSSTNPIPAGSGGAFNVNATGPITVSSPIQATTGLQADASEPSGDGGTINLNSTGGTISVNSPITVSSADAQTAPPSPRRKSRSGGNINLKSDAPAGVAINVSNTAQLLSLLDVAAPGPGGKITILATGASSRLQITGDPGSAGKPPPDTIRADRGSIDIRHTGAAGTITMTTATVSADIVKMGALGANGSLTIGGGRIDANTVLKLYATGANGSVIFVSNVVLNLNSTNMLDRIIIAGNSVTVNNNVVVAIGSPAGASRTADIYVPNLAGANYSNFNGGNSTTNGMFIIDGTQGPSPTSGAVTHVGVAPPAFGPPGGP